MTAAYVYDAVRTPFGRYGGALAGVRPDDLAAHVVRALARARAGARPGAIDDVIFGNANGAGEDNRNVARMAALLAGLPTSCRARPSTACAARPRSGDAGQPRDRDRRRRRRRSPAASSR